jgi:hypothetical protein
MAAISSKTESAKKPAWAQPAPEGGTRQDLAGPGDRELLDIVRS